MDLLLQPAQRMVILICHKTHLIVTTQEVTVAKESEQLTTSGMTSGFRQAPSLVRVWKVELRGRDNNEERIYNWRLEGSIDGQNYTTIFTPPNPTYLGNIVQYFPTDTTERYIYIL